MRSDAAAAKSLLSDRTKEEREIKSDKRRLNASFYMVCSALFGAISVLGLFFGFFMRGSVGALIAGGEPILRGSYLGVIVEVIRGSIALPKPSGYTLSEQLPVFLYFAVYALAAGVLLSLVLSVLTFVRAGSARFFCTLNGFLTLFLYGTLCVAGVLLGSLRQELYSWRQADLPSLTAALLAFGVFAAMAIAHRGARGAVNALLLLINACSVCAFIFPHTPLLDDLNGIAIGGTDMAKRILMGFLILVTVANLVLSVLRLERPRAQAMDIFRFGVQFVAALGLAAAYLAEGSVADFFTAQPLASVFLLLSPLCALLTAAFAFTFRRREEKDAPAEERPAAPLPEQTEALAEQPQE